MANQRNQKKPENIRTHIQDGPAFGKLQASSDLSPQKKKKKRTELKNDREKHKR